MRGCWCVRSQKWRAARESGSGREIKINYSVLYEHHTGIWYLLISMDAFFYFGLNGFFHSNVHTIALYCDIWQWPRILWHCRVCVCVCAAGRGVAIPLLPCSLHRLMATVQSARKSVRSLDKVIRQRTTEAHTHTKCFSPIQTTLMKREL